MNIRKYPLVNNCVYHVFNKSIEGFRIFNHESDFLRFISLLSYYRFANVPVKHSKLLELTSYEQVEILDYLVGRGNKLVEIVAYCLMPTHFHLILKQLIDNGISKFISQIQNSYSHYFNTKYDRKGPLWQGYFKNVQVVTDAQLLHLTRYIHLNPVIGGLVDNPIKWDFSSYKEYLRQNDKIPVCNFDGLISIKPKIYKKFVNNRINYQRELTRIKKIILE